MTKKKMTLDNLAGMMQRQFSDLKGEVLNSKEELGKEIKKTRKELKAEIKDVNVDSASTQKNDYSPSNPNPSSNFSEDNIGVSTQIDDFYVIDYSKNNKKKMNSQSVAISQMTGVSNRLAEVIEREKINNTKAKKLTTPVPPQSPATTAPAADLVERLEVAYENTTKSNNRKSVEPSQPSVPANLILKATRVKFGKGLMESVRSFQFIPA